LNVKPSIGCKGLWDDKKRICVCLYAKLGAAFRCLLDSRREMICTRNFEGACTRDKAFVFNSVLYASKPIAKRIVDLRKRVLVGA
jgi:hypothetical protein